MLIDDVVICNCCGDNMGQLHHQPAPQLRFVNVDFSAQRPDWYVEPSVEAA